VGQTHSVQCSPQGISVRDEILPLRSLNAAATSDGISEMSSVLLFVSVSYISVAPGKPNQWNTAVTLPPV
jgi:hypothetical protein